MNKFEDGPRLYRCARGGGWNNQPRNARASLRLWLEPRGRSENFGLRLVGVDTETPQASRPGSSL